jgi:hypothetical protein
VVGVFRRNDQSEEPIIWRLEKQASELFPYLRKTQLPVFNQADENVYRAHGEELYNLLFPVKETKARAAFEAFVGRHLKDHEPASMFVRLVEPGLSPPFFVPLGLVRVNGEFLGFHFRIEVPLQVQEYRQAPACVSRWVMVLPPKEGGVDEALAQARASAGAFNKWSAVAEKVFDNTMSEFGTWLRARSGEDPATALVVLSHHFDNQLSFAAGDAITSQSVAREFIRPSVVILNGCGTALPGTVDFIGKLNRNGFETVIATNTQVEGAMAGQFLDCLATALAANSEAADAESGISRAYFNALQCLKSRKSPKIGSKEYGARVLGYTLLGNGNIQLCPPK